jgi:hypothetical protein
MQRTGFEPAVTGSERPHNHALGCVHTKRVQSSPVKVSQIHKDAAMALLLAFNGRRGGSYTPAASSQVESTRLAESKV